MLSQTSGYVLTTLVTGPASGDLALLANVKDEMSIQDTTQDIRLRRLIAEESAGIARYCKRIFGQALWMDQFRPQRSIWGDGVRAASNPLMLSKYPLFAQPVAFVANTEQGSQSVTGIASTAGLARCQPVFGPGINPGTTITAIVNGAIVISQPANASGTAVQLSANVGICETIAGTATWLVAGTDYEIEVTSNLPGDEGAAMVYRLNYVQQPRTWASSLIQIWYQAGYTLPNNCAEDAGTPPTEYEPAPYNLPGDLETACIRILVMRSTKRGRDPLLVARDQPGTVGSQRWWVGAMPGQKSPYPPDIEAMLDTFRVPTIA
jgi:hypothetical protein